MNSFLEAEEQYLNLRQSYAAGRISREQLDAAVEDLIVRDDQANFWKLGAEGAKWFTYDRTGWVQADPPEVGALTRDTASSLRRLPVIATVLIAFVCMFGYGAFMLASSRGWFNPLPSDFALATQHTAAPGPTVLLDTPAPSPTASLTPTHAAFTAPVPLKPSGAEAALTMPTIVSSVPSVPPLPAFTSTLVSTLTSTPLPTSSRRVAESTSTPAARLASIPAGVYVTALRLQPSRPRRGQEITFLVTFLNTAGKPAELRWGVFVYRPANRYQSFGQTSMRSGIVQANVMEALAAGSWKLTGGGPCEEFGARVAWMRPNEGLAMLASPGGQTFEQRFSVCP